MSGILHSILNHAMRQTVPMAIRACCAWALIGAGSAMIADAATRPNIVLIYADDLGYGDAGCYGATGIETPNIDRLAASGLKFTDGHAPAATCTPSRYALLTGEYAFRKKGTGVLPGDAGMIIEPGRLTLPAMLKQAGYATGVVGKWHLGLGAGKLDWNGDIKPGPLEIGFDYSYLMPATGDRVPCAYVENHRIVGLDPADPILINYRQPFAGEPTGKANPDLLRMHPSHGHDQAIVNGVSRIGYMSGGKSARWVDEDMADVFVEQAKHWIQSQSKDKPFFLYFATHDIHVPRLPHPRFIGKSRSGLRGDAAHELDWCVGELLQVLEQQQLTENTLIIFTSDNGPVVDDGYRDGAVENLGQHRPAGPYRGGKYSNFEAGTRVPWIMHWPKQIAAGSSAALVCQVDLLRSLAELVDVSLPDNAAPDSQNVLNALLGKSPQGRDTLVEQATTRSWRSANWKFIPAHPGPAVNRQVNIELGNANHDQLYDLSADPGEQHNVAAEHEDLVKQFKAELQAVSGD